MLAHLKTVYLRDLSQMCLPTHPRVFVRFGKTKGEIWVEKGDFRGDLGFFWGVWTLFGNQPPNPPILGKTFPEKKTFPLDTLMKTNIDEEIYLVYFVKYSITLYNRQAIAIAVISQNGFVQKGLALD